MNFIKKLFSPVGKEIKDYYYAQYLRKDCLYLGLFIFICGPLFSGFDFTETVSDIQAYMYAIPRWFSVFSAAILLVFNIFLKDKVSIKWILRSRNLFNLSIVLLILSWGNATLEFLEANRPLHFNEVSTSVLVVSLWMVLFNRISKSFLFTAALAIYFNVWYGFHKGILQDGMNLDDPFLVLIAGLIWINLQKTNIANEIKVKKLETQTRWLSDVLEHDLSNQLLGLIFAWDGYKNHLKDSPDRNSKSEEIIDGTVGSIRSLLSSAQMKKAALDKAIYGIQNENISPDKLKDMICKHLTPFTSIKKQNLHIKISSDTENIVCDPEITTYQMIANLVVNASKYSPNGSDIWLEICYKDSKLKIEVTDQGPGIDHFDKESLPTAGQHSKSGNGTGLKLTKSIVEDLGGNLTFDSNSKGTTATIII